MLNLDLIHTVAFAGVVLFVGYGLCRLIRPLSRYNIPPPVVGGLIIAVIILIARQNGVTIFKFDISLRRNNLGTCTYCSGYMSPKFQIYSSRR
jgi:ESS family glutamate:Na+ symporter